MGYFWQNQSFQSCLYMFRCLLLIAGQLTVVRHEGRVRQQRLHGHDHRLRQARVPLSQVSAGSKVMSWWYDSELVSFLWKPSSNVYAGLFPDLKCSRQCSATSSWRSRTVELMWRRLMERQWSCSSLTSTLARFVQTFEICHKIDFSGHWLQECLCGGALQGSR